MHQPERIQKMIETDEYQAPLPSLLNGDYCTETTEELPEVLIPDYLRMLWKRREEKLKTLRKNEEETDRQ